MGLEEVFAQETKADTTMPFKAGIGLDAGESVPVGGGYRGGALNLAARFCSLVRSGEVLVSEGVTYTDRPENSCDAPGSPSSPELRDGRIARQRGYDCFLPW
jgi:class 3 adenylate cyclase